MIVDVEDIIRHQELMEEIYTEEIYVDDKDLLNNVHASLFLVNIWQYGTQGQEDG
jgi:hypothetical protein